MCIRPIKTKEDFKFSLQLIDLTWQAEEGTCDEERFQILSILIENFERSHYPIDLPVPIAAIHYFMHYHDHGENNFAELVGSQESAKAILLKQTPLTLPLIEKLYREWGIPPTLLIKPYKLEEKEE